ncbi:hypothetical protein SPLC1_S202780 [Arthrospira platensis C1]|nr:hypothetical protein SPLC1_S202780 [Arthrospira platensis C1]
MFLWVLTAFSNQAIYPNLRRDGKISAVGYNASLRRF